jgi:hypothetical protein
MSTVVMLFLGAVPASADTQNTKPWVAGAPIPPDPDGGGASGATEGACASMIGGKIYHAFGFDPASGDTRGLRIYDPTTDSWSLGPAAPPPGRSEFYEGVAHGGKLYCVGGRPDGALLIFNTATRTWSAGAPVPGAPRSGLAAATFGNNIFIFGGRGPGVPCSPGAIPPGAGLSNNILRYDIDKNAWFGAGNLVTARSDATAARVGRRVYIFGGCNGPGVFPDPGEVYDPRTGTSSPLSAAMPGGGRADLAAADPQNGGSANASHRIHITGGFNYSTGGPTPALNHPIYDVDQRTFVTGVPMPTHCPGTIDRAEHSLVYHGDRIFAVGGACPGMGASINNLDFQKLSDPPVSSASMTAYSCNRSTFPSCSAQPAGSSVVFVTGSGFAPSSIVSLSSSLQGPLPPASTNVQGEFATRYVDTHCNRQRDTITGSDSSGHTTSITFTCP